MPFWPERPIWGGNGFPISLSTGLWIRWIYETHQARFIHSAPPMFQELHANDRAVTQTEEKIPTFMGLVWILVGAGEDRC